MRPLLFLDFDGVIGDSIPECFVVSWVAYYQRLLKKNPVSVTLADYSLFREFRPFIRIGSDYLFLQKAVDTGIVLSDQTAFDRFLESHHQDIHEEFYRLFYQVREEMLLNQADYWYSLNPLFPHMQEFLERAASISELYILSTKKPWFIGKILEFNGIQMDSSRIIGSGKEIKVNIIEDIMKKTAVSRAVFIDDQIDHFKYISNSLIEAYLPNWGYIEPGWLQKSDYHILTPENSFSLFQEFLKA